MGQFPYELQLKGVKAPPENVTRVNTYLGNIIEFSLILKNLTSEIAEFVIQVIKKIFIIFQIIYTNGIKFKSRFFF